MHDDDLDEAVELEDLLVFAVLLVVVQMVQDKVEQVVEEEERRPAVVAGRLRLSVPKDIPVVEDQGMVDRRG